VGYLPETRVQALISLKVADAVATVAALKALTVPTTNGAIIPVQNDGSGLSAMYRYDATSSATESLPYIVQPTVGAGRYFRGGNSAEETMKPPVSCISFIGSRTIVQIDALVPSEGWSVWATDAGTPVLPGSDALVAGDIAEYNGTGWKRIVSASGGFPPIRTWLIAHASATLYSPLTDVTDQSKPLYFADAAGTIALVPAADGELRVVKGEGSVYENYAYIFDATAFTLLKSSGVVHATSHVTGGSDVIANAIAGGNSGLMSGTDKTKIDALTAPTLKLANLLDNQAGWVSTGITFLTTGSYGHVGTFSIYRDATRFMVGNIYLAWGDGSVEALCTLAGQESSVFPGILIQAVRVDATTCRLDYKSTSTGSGATFKSYTLPVGV